MAKAAFKALTRDVESLNTLVHAVEESSLKFEELSRQYAKIKLSTRDDSSIHGILRRYFQIFLTAMDDAMVLFTGKLCRAYHKKQHENLFHESPSALHSRGRESQYFKHTEDFSRCSVDGFNFEYREFLGRKDSYKYEEVYQTE